MHIYVFCTYSFFSSLLLHLPHKWLILPHSCTSIHKIGTSRTDGLFCSICIRSTVVYVMSLLASICNCHFLIFALHIFILHWTLCYLLCILNMAICDLCTSVVLFWLMIALLIVDLMVFSMDVSSLIILRCGIIIYFIVELFLQTPVILFVFTFCGLHS